MRYKQVDYTECGINKWTIKLRYKKCTIQANYTTHRS